jgi:peptide/nickel transport system substrate-binding protein
MSETPGLKRSDEPRRRVPLWAAIVIFVLAVVGFFLASLHMGSMGIAMQRKIWGPAHGNGHASDSQTLKFLIESSPNNLDLRQGTDAQSERVGGLIYDALVKKDAHFVLQPWLATSWERPDPLTWVFHIREGVRFHDGKPLTADDVAWSIRSMIDGTLITAKGGTLAEITSVEASGPLTVTVRTKEPDDSLLFNLSDGLFGVVEKGAGSDEGLHPVGTGPFKFVSQMQDRDVVLERNADYWEGAPKIARIRFEVVPDTITAALEIRKGSADVESNVLTQDMVEALRKERNVVVQSGPGAMVMYANFNTIDPALRDPRVRQAIACAIDRPALIAALWRGQARLADTLLPEGHWAAADDAELPQYPHDVARAVQLLDAAGFKPDKDGVRLRFTLKTSTDETTRLVSQAMQQEMRAAGIALTLRPAEFGTFYSDITRGAFQMYMLRWIGSNEDPDFLRYAFATASFPPKGGNRGHYSNPRVDALLAQANVETDEAARRREYVEVQQILARDLPSIPLWYPNNEVVHSTRLTGVQLDPGGTFDFLRTAELR